MYLNITLNQKKGYIMQILKIMVFILVFSGYSFSAIQKARLLTDNTPDFSTVSNAAHSITDKWETDEQKAIALWKWMSNARFQVATVRDSLSTATVPGGDFTYGAIFDPVILNNNYGNYFCVIVASVIGKMWKTLGKEAQEHDINLHTVVDLKYNNAWHVFDASMGFYYKDPDDNHILSCDEVMARRSNVTMISSDVTTCTNFFGVGQMGIG
jgi:hypothetical protein